MTGSRDQTARELPQYVCHKRVWALRIARIEHRADGSAVIFPADAGYGAFQVDAAYVTKHDPKSGGYYVEYADGYKSWSPAEAFEGGYTRI